MPHQKTKYPEEEQEGNPRKIDIPRHKVSSISTQGAETWKPSIQRKPSTKPNNPNQRKELKK